MAEEEVGSYYRKGGFLSEKCGVKSVDLFQDDTGGIVWTAVAIGAVFDAIIIYAAIKQGSGGLGLSGKLF